MPNAEVRANQPNVSESMLTSQFSQLEHVPLDPNLVEVGLLQKANRFESFWQMTSVEKTATEIDIQVENNLLIKLLESLDSGEVMMVTRGKYVPECGEYVMYSQGIETAAENGLQASLQHLQKSGLSAQEKQGWQVEIQRNVQELEEAKIINQLRGSQQKQQLLVVSPFPEDMPETFAQQRGYFPAQKKSAIRSIEVDGDSITISQVFVETLDQRALQVAMRYMGTSTRHDHTPTQMLGQRLLATQVHSSPLLSLIKTYDEVLRRQHQRKGEPAEFFFGKRVHNQNSYEQVVQDIDSMAHRSQPYVKALKDFYKILAADLETQTLSYSLQKEIIDVLNLETASGKLVVSEEDSRKALGEALSTQRLTPEAASQLAYLRLNAVGLKFRQRAQIVQTSSTESAASSYIDSNSDKYFWNRALSEVAASQEWMAYCGFGRSNAMVGMGIEANGFMPTYFGFNPLELIKGFNCPAKDCRGWIPQGNGDTCPHCKRHKTEIAKITGKPVC